jgi:hypothetical protein
MKGHLNELAKNTSVLLAHKLHRDFYSRLDEFSPDSRVNILEGYRK